MGGGHGDGIARIKELAGGGYAFDHFRIVVSCVRQSCSRGGTKLGDIRTKGSGKMGLETVGRSKTSYFVFLDARAAPCTANTKATARKGPLRVGGSAQLAKLLARQT